MRCREIRDRIASSATHETGWIDQPEVQAHLKACRGCADQARAAGLLNKLLLLAGGDDTVNPTPIEVQRRLVERRISLRESRQERPIAAATRRPSRRRNVPALAAGTIAVAVALLTVVPFTYDRTIGYDLTLDGVSRHLVTDNEKLCDLLFRLELFEAGVDVISCDTTCSLSILDLKSKREASLVAGAIARLNEAALTTSIVPIHTKTSGSLLDQVNERLRRGRS